MRGGEGGWRDRKREGERKKDGKGAGRRGGEIMRASYKLTCQSPHKGLLILLLFLKIVMN